MQSNKKSNYNITTLKTDELEVFSALPPILPTLSRLKSGEDLGPRYSFTPNTNITITAKLTADEERSVAPHRSKKSKVRQKNIFEQLEKRVKYTPDEIKANRANAFKKYLSKGRVTDFTSAKRNDAFKNDQYNIRKKIALDRPRVGGSFSPQSHPVVTGEASLEQHQQQTPKTSKETNPHGFFLKSSTKRYLSKSFAYESETYFMIRTLLRKLKKTTFSKAFEELVERGNTPFDIHMRLCNFVVKTNCCNAENRTKAASYKALDVETSHLLQIFDASKPDDEQRDLSATTPTNRP